MEMELYTFSHSDHMKLIKPFWDSKQYNLKVTFIKQTTQTIWILKVKEK